jgi:hypothetical protein
VLGAVSAIDSTDVSTYEDSNLDDSADALSTQDKLEISNEDSISETNLVNSHDDNLEDYPADVVGIANNGSDYGDNDGKMQASNIVGAENNNSESVSSDMNADANLSSSDSVSGSSDKSNVLTASGDVPTKITISDTTYSQSGAVFRVILKSEAGYPLSGQRVTLNIDNATYIGSTNVKGVALIKTHDIARGTYMATLTYGGNSKYANTSLTQKVKVYSSISGSNIEKELGVTSVFQATFYKNGGVLANTEVSFRVGNKTYKRVTDSNGVAKLNIGLSAGEHNIVSYNPYSKESRVNKVYVYKGAATIKQTYSKPYILPNNKYTFNVLLKSTYNVPIKNAIVYVKYNNKVVSAKTNTKGKASVVISGYKDVGVYNITYYFKGNSNYNATNGSGNIYVHNPVYKFKSYNITMKYNDKTRFGVILLDEKNKPLANKKIKIIINKKAYTRVTNSKGWAGLTIGKLKPASYSVSCTYLTSGSYYYTECKNKLVISKLEARLYANNLIMNYGDNAYYKVIVKDASGKNIKKVQVEFKINGKCYYHKTNSKGVAALGIKLGIGLYPIRTVVVDDYYKSNVKNKLVLVNGTVFISSDRLVSIERDVHYAVKVVDGLHHPINKAKILFVCNGKKYSAYSDADGVARVNLGKLPKGTFTVKFSHNKATGSATIKVFDRISLDDIVKVSKEVKEYIEDKEELPSSVKIGSYTYSIAQYLYLAAQAANHIKSGDDSSVLIKLVKNPKSPQEAAYLSNLYNYQDVAKYVIAYGNKNGLMPDYAPSDVGDIGYDGLVYAFARVVAFYGDKGVAPSYTAIKGLSEEAVFTSSLNSKNTISNLAAYLAASTNCQVNDARIQELASSLTAGLTSNAEKAEAIFNYVRDTVSYSFYYDTRYGAIGTLDAGTGNCVDHSHAVVALYRAADLPARYVHGTCTFSSGSTYGHVWAQVLIGDTWVVSDACSSRNSLGEVVNWNADSYSLNGYYADLQF